MCTVSGDMARWCVSWSSADFGRSGKNPRHGRAEDDHTGRSIGADAVKSTSNQEVDYVQGTMYKNRKVGNFHQSSVSHLQALRVERVGRLACRPGGARRRSRPALSTTLTVLCHGATSRRGRRLRRRSLAGGDHGRRTGTASGGGPLADSDVGGSAALVALGGDDLVVEFAQLEAGCGPGSEVVADGDGTAGALGAADGPELGEGGSPYDRGLVDALAGVDVVDGAVGSDGAEGLRAGGGVVVAKVLNDVVLDEGISLVTMSVYMSTRS